MGMRKRIGVIALGLAAVCGVWLSANRGSADPAAPAKVVRIGLVSTLFRDTPPSLIDILSKPLKTLMESQTGLTGNLELGGDAIALGQALKDNKVQLGVFHGVEFAWARLHHPNLKALVIAVSQTKPLQACLVVRKDCTATTCGDLKGKALAIPFMSREHIHLFLARRCPAPGIDPKTYYSQITKPSDAEDALDDVVSGTVQATIVDRVVLDKFQVDKPARFGQLRILQQSEAFPAAVVAYHPGAIDEATLKSFREGMIAASKTERGKELLKMCRITAFEALPEDFERQLQETVRAYPPK